MNAIPEIRLKKNLIRDSRSNAGVHPWIFSGTVASPSYSIPPGTVVKVIDSSGNFTGFGHFNPLSSIRIGLFSMHEDELPDDAFWFDRISKAVKTRQKLKIASDACRLVFSESDSLPGLIADKYSDFIVIQTLSAGMDLMKSKISNFLMETCNAAAVIERNDCEIRRLEGLEPKKGLVAGIKEPPTVISISENGLKFSASLLDGQKTGFYIDQRENRKKVAEFVERGMDILDCFSFSGGFSVYSAAAGAGSATLLDESEKSLELARKNIDENGFSSLKTVFHKGDAFKLLREFRDRAMTFDMIILDPPKFAPSHSDLEKASRGYKDINLLAMKLLRDGGTLATFSCSSGLSREDFREILFRAAKDSGRNVNIISTLGQAPDHPIRLNFPESEYLKGYVCRIMD